MVRSPTVRRADDERKPKRHTMTEYPEDYPTLSTGPPPVIYSDRVYDYPPDPESSRPTWLPLVAVIGVCVAVIVLMIATTVVLISSSRPPQRTTTVATVA